METVIIITVFNQLAYIAKSMAMLKYHYFITSINTT